MERILHNPSLVRMKHPNSLLIVQQMRNIILFIGHSCVLFPDLSAVSVYENQLIEQAYCIVRNPSKIPKHDIFSPIIYQAPTAPFWLPERDSGVDRFTVRTSHCPRIIRRSRSPTVRVHRKELSTVARLRGAKRERLP
jgi:hypothetical protein